MSVNIRVPQFLEHLTGGQKLLEVKGSTVGECLNELIGKYPALKERLFDNKGKLLKPIDVFVNGKSAYPEELKKKVKDGDELYIMLVLAGG